MDIAVESSAPRRPGWRWLVLVVCFLAGLGFATSARVAAGSDLRAPGIASLADAVRAAEQRVHVASRQAAALQDQLDRLTSRSVHGDSAAARAQAALARLRGPGGLTPLAGPGLEVVLDDAPTAPAGITVDPNQLLVHQSDLQAVLNALWAGGAEAVSILGQRIVATSAIRCVGPTLLLNGQVFSPPYRVAAIGPAGRMQQALAASPGVALFEEAAAYYGLGYTVEPRPRIAVPAYRGPVTLAYATATARRR